MNDINRGRLAGGETPADPKSRDDGAPSARKRLMARELRIGLSVIGILVVVLIVALVKRFSATDTLPAVALGKEPAAATLAPAAAHAATRQPTVVTGNAVAIEAAPPRTFDPPQWNTPNRYAPASDAPPAEPRTSFMPGSTPAGGRAASSRYDSPADASPPRHAAADAAYPGRGTSREIYAAAQPDPYAAALAASDKLPPRGELPTGAALSSADGEAAAPPQPITRAAQRTTSIVVVDDDYEAPAMAADLAAPSFRSAGRATDAPRDTFTERRTAALPAVDLAETSPAVRPSVHAEPLADRVPQRGVRPADGKFVAGPNDTFWSISEKAYGTGGYFKALVELNRDRYPRPDRLKVGDVVLVPEAAELRAAFPDLCPKVRRAGTSGVLVATPRYAQGSRFYLVEEGDTIYDIARYELGKASRWAEIIELNRNLLGDDIDFLRPGMKLVLPPPVGAERLARPADEGRF